MYTLRCNENGKKKGSPKIRPIINGSWQGEMLMYSNKGQVKRMKPQYIPKGFPMFM
jgi:hypothetical protein